MAVDLPLGVASIEDLSGLLERAITPGDRPFFFKIEASVDTSVYHVMALPPGTEVTSPDIAHAPGRTYFGFAGDADLLGFFSTDHKGVFTHQNAFTHIHILSADRKHLGHLDSLRLSNSRNVLYLPANIAFNLSDETI